MQSPETALASSAVATHTEPVVSADTFIRRLRRLLVLRYRASHYLDADDIRLLDHCIFATFCDCRDVGAEDEACRLLDEARASRSDAVAL
jgi:hypothetical protein